MEREDNRMYDITIPRPSRGAGECRRRSRLSDEVQMNGIGWDACAHLCVSVWVWPCICASPYVRIIGCKPLRAILCVGGHICVRTRVCTCIDACLCDQRHEICMIGKQKTIKIATFIIGKRKTIRNAIFYNRNRKKKDDQKSDFYNLKKKDNQKRRSTPSGPLQIENNSDVP